MVEVQEIITDLCGVDSVHLREWVSVWGRI